MDGRAQDPVTRFLREYFGVDYVDMVTEPGPNGILARSEPEPLVDSIAARIRISVEHHNSVGIAVAGHDGCAGNPVPKAEQDDHTRRAVSKLRGLFPGLEIIGLWVSAEGEISQIPCDE